MNKHILVPINGTYFSAMALSYARGLAKRLGSTITLLHVAEPIKRARRADFESRIVPLWELMAHAAMAIRGELDQMALADSDDGVTIKSVVQFGNPAEEIAAFADNNDDDLIVMASHARIGLARFLHGSVAEAVIRLTNIPVLVMRTGRQERLANKSA